MSEPSRQAGLAPGDMAVAGGGKGRLRQRRFGNSTQSIPVQHHLHTGLTFAFIVDQRGVHQRPGVGLLFGKPFRPAPNVLMVHVERYGNARLNDSPLFLHATTTGQDARRVRLEREA